MTLTHGHRMHGIGAQGIEINLGQGEAAAVQIEFLFHASVDDVAFSPECFIDFDSPGPAFRIELFQSNPFVVGKGQNTQADRGTV